MRRKSYTAGYKLDVIKAAKTFGTRAAALKFDVTETMVRKWKASEQKFMSCERKRRSFRRGAAKWPKLEEQLKEWVLKKRNQGRAVKIMNIRKEASRLSEDLGLEDFTSSLHWCQNFMKRNGFVMRRRTSIGQPLPDDSKEK